MFETTTIINNCTYNVIIFSVLVIIGFILTARMKFNRFSTATLIQNIRNTPCMQQIII